MPFMMEGMQSDYDGMMVQTNQIYSYHVERGDFAPYMNYLQWPSNMDRFPIGEMPNLPILTILAVIPPYDYAQTRF